jgi:hypothetical protein
MIILHLGDRAVFLISSTCAPIVMHQVFVRGIQLFVSGITLDQSKPETAMLMSALLRLSKIAIPVWALSRCFK